MTQKDLISVIIPVYNRADVLNRSVDSILNQTYENLELILVDDGSADDSGRICREYEDKDSRIRFIQQENRGVSAARNAGITNSRGEYIYCIDSDDAASPHLLEKLHDDLVKYDADCAFCRYIISEDYIDDFEMLNDDVEITDWKTAYSRHVFTLGYSWTPGTKMYRRNLVMEPEQLMFREGVNYAEDHLWFSEIIQKSEKAIIDKSTMLLYISGSNNSLYEKASLEMKYIDLRRRCNYLIEHDFPKEQIDAVAKERDRLLRYILCSGR